ncbi:cytochrome B562 [[Actinobacillus] muris]|uniref:Cytochrome B562 n=1 Tax=Muribacter muris TaxID=67855 RepID=A0A0J5P6W6_9PAST|nr:cytochrome b562 [Muribacter muris]KMK51515.1 cytochrome B562 [[Actinobacillus] muris] [Muribacter muris]
MKCVKWAIALFSLAFATVSVANVSIEMFQMNRQVGQLLNADSAEAFQQSTDKFIEAANQAKGKMPRSLNGDQNKFSGYQQGMQEVIDVVSQAKLLAEQGKLTEAKATVAQLNALKKLYHSEYK